MWQDPHALFDGQHSIEIRSNVPGKPDIDSYESLHCFSLIFVVKTDNITY